jgi:hypothetical protein
LLRANPIGRFFRAVTFAQDRSIWRQLKGEVPPRRTMGTGKKILLALGALAGLQGMAGAMIAQELRAEQEARPDIEVTATATGRDAMIKARGLDRDITGMTAVLDFQRHRADKRWTGDPCGVTAIGPAVVGDTVQWQVNTEEGFAPCDYRLTIDGVPFTYWKPGGLIRPRADSRFSVTREQIGPNRYHVNIRGPIGDSQVQLGLQRGCGARKLGGGIRISEDWMQYTVDTRGMRGAACLGRVRVEGGAHPFVDTIRLDQ